MEDGVYFATAAIFYLLSSILNLRQACGTIMLIICRCKKGSFRERYTV
jgi:hypothetical protein